MHDTPGLTRAALQAGAVAVVSKLTQLQQLIDVIAESVADPVARRARSIAALDEPPVPGEAILSRRQVEILEAVVAGMNVRQIGAAHGISYKTVNNHLTAIYRRLDAQNLTQAIVAATRLGLLRVGPHA
jgi:DNA-binding NarL/FixJ family response regulator